MRNTVVVSVLLERSWKVRSTMSAMRKDFQMSSFIPVSRDASFVAPLVHCDESRLVHENGIEEVSISHP